MLRALSDQVDPAAAVLGTGPTSNSASTAAAEMATMSQNAVSPGSSAPTIIPSPAHTLQVPHVGSTPFSVMAQTPSWDRDQVSGTM